MQMKEFKITTESARTLLAYGIFLAITIDVIFKLYPAQPRLSAIPLMFYPHFSYSSLSTRHDAVTCNNSNTKQICRHTLSFKHENNTSYCYTRGTLSSQPRLSPPAPRQFHQHSSSIAPFLSAAVQALMGLTLLLLTISRTNRKSPGGYQWKGTART